MSLCPDQASRTCRAHSTDSVLSRLDVPESALHCSYTILPVPATMPTMPLAAFVPKSRPEFRLAMREMTTHEATNAVLLESAGPCWHRQTMTPFHLAPKQTRKDLQFVKGYPGELTFFL